MKQVTIPAQWLQELIALCGPEDHELRERVMKSAAPAPADALATATGLPAQSVAASWKDHHTAQLVNQLRDCATTYGQTQQLRERIATIVAPLCDQLKAHQSVLLPAAPQAQADARDAVQEVLMEHSGCGSNTQVDMLTVRLNPGDKVVMHKSRITQGFDRANRAAQAAAKGE